MADQTETTTVEEVSEEEVSEEEAPEIDYIQQREERAREEGFAITSAEEAAENGEPFMRFLVIGSDEDGNTVLKTYDFVGALDDEEHDEEGGLDMCLAHAKAEAEKMDTVHDVLRVDRRYSFRP